MCEASPLSIRLGLINLNNAAGSIKNVKIGFIMVKTVSIALEMIFRWLECQPGIDGPATAGFGESLIEEKPE